MILFLQFQSYAYDMGVPVRNSSQPANIFINILRNNFPPQFINTPYSVNIQESHSGGSSVFQTTAVDQDTNVSCCLFLMFVRKWNCVPEKDNQNLWVFDQQKDVIILSVCCRFETRLC